MKILARKGVTIVYAKKVKHSDGTKTQMVDIIPPDRDAIVIWKDQFGSIHGVGFGDIDTDPQYDGESIREFVERALEKF